MGYLVRKISQAKWPEEVCKCSDIAGDAIGDLRTTGNTLSLWRIESEDDLGDAVLALSASSKSSKMESFAVVWISESSISDKNIAVDTNSPGDTIISDLKDMHRDLCGITHQTLGELAEIILSELHENGHTKRFTKSEIKIALAKAYKEKRISEEECDPELLEAIQKATNLV